MKRPVYLCLNTRCVLCLMACPDTVCSACDHKTYKQEAYPLFSAPSDLLRSEVILFENNKWKVTKVIGAHSGWIIGDNIGDNWVQYRDGAIGYDHPERIPQYIKDLLKKELSILEEA